MIAVYLIMTTYILVNAEPVEDILIQALQLKVEEKGAKGFMVVDWPSGTFPLKNTSQPSDFDA